MVVWGNERGGGDGGTKNEWEVVWMRLRTSEYASRRVWGLWMACMDGRLFPHMPGVMRDLGLWDGASGRRGTAGGFFLGVGNLGKIPNEIGRGGGDAGVMWRRKRAGALPAYLVVFLGCRWLDSKRSAPESFELFAETVCLLACLLLAVYAVFNRG